MHHAHVVTAELLLNFLAHQVCLLCTDSDNVSLQLEINSTHVSKFTLLLHSQPVGLGLLVELFDKWRRTRC